MQAVCRGENCVCIRLYLCTTQKHIMLKYNVYASRTSPTVVQIFHTLQYKNLWAATDELRRRRYVLHHVLMYNKTRVIYYYYHRRRHRLRIQRHIVI